MERTYSAKPKDIKRKWYIVDARDKILGRLASRVARILLGKHKPIFTSHIDTGDYVVVLNSAKIRVTGNKLKQKVYQRYSGYPSGQKETTLETMLQKKPTEVVRLAVKRMLPGNPLGRKRLKKLKVFADDRCPYQTKDFINIEVN